VEEGLWVQKTQKTPDNVVIETRKQLQQHSHRRKKATTMTLGWPWNPSPPNRLRQTNYYAANESNRKKRREGERPKELLGSHFHAVDGQKTNI
ncbi:hypothetical protein Gotri_001782, partial [Gossypium trilobum]|nr:hypothetical protein [Gossypium trilobum]